MELESIVLRETSQPEKARYRVILLICGLEGLRLVIGKLETFLEEDGQ